MAETVKGGMYLSADGKTWHDASGKVIKTVASLTVKTEEHATPAPQVEDIAPPPMVSPLTGETATTKHRLSKSKKAK
jgi:hypothetical protein